ncbi:MAG TPA: CBS domain-containing protein [Candidatus Manganitrophaceae bacterium]|nr:CBS domain-containing protein [Candidatus Manganitrophaceae bacterium]
MSQKETLTIGDRMSSDPVTIKPDQSIGEAFVLMFERDIRHLPVIEKGKLVGIVSDRDIRQFLGKASLSEEDRKQEDRYLRLPVSEVMSRHPLKIKAEAPIAEGIRIMVERKIGALPVVDREEKMIGIFTELDALEYSLHVVERYQEEKTRKAV